MNLKFTDGQLKKNTFRDIQCILFLFICMSVYVPCLYVYHMHVSNHRGQKRVSDTLELDLKMVVIHNLSGCLEMAWVFCNSTKCSTIEPSLHPHASYKLYYLLCITETMCFILFTCNFRISTLRNSVFCARVNFITLKNI